MQQGKQLIIIGAVLLAGIVLQLVLIFAESKDTPSKAAVGFATEYYNLSPSMTDYLCSELAEQRDAGMVQDYINQVADQARQSGFELSYMRKRLFSVHTEILSQTESAAEVRITAKAKRNINPAFTIIAKLFFIGETYPIDETLNLIREEGKWKVCGQVFDLAV